MIRTEFRHLDVVVVGSVTFAADSMGEYKIRKNFGFSLGNLEVHISKQARLLKKETWDERNDQQKEPLY